MKLEFSESGLKPVDEKIILITIIGVLESLENGALTIDEAEKYLFSPHTVRKLYEKKCSLKIIRVIEKGCELEDIASLIPESLSKVIGEIKHEAIGILNSYEEFNKAFWIEE